MDIASSIAASRLVAQSHAIDVIANNIANADTPGFQEQRVQFSDWLSTQTDARTPPGGRVLAYTQDRATWRETAPGQLTHTANPLDLAITGPGYFTIMTKAGPRLTRDGRFGLMPDGTIADAAGNPLLDSSGQPIRLATTDTGLSVAGDGSLSSRVRQIGRVGVVQPADPTLLRAEGSNVQPITELTRMLDTARQFQFVTQFVQAESTRRQNVIDKLLPPASTS